VRGRAHLSASTSAKGANLQGVRGREHLPAPAPKEQMQGVRGGGHLPAPAPKEQMHGVRGREHLPAPAPKEPRMRWAGITGESSQVFTIEFAHEIAQEQKIIAREKEGYALAFASAPRRPGSCRLRRRRVRSGAATASERAREAEI
jgi:hypothetical protein